MKKRTSSHILEKINVAKERIKELETLINYWEACEPNRFLDTEYSINPSSPDCLMLDD